MDKRFNNEVAVIVMRNIIELSVNILGAVQLEQFP